MNTSGGPPPRLLSTGAVFLTVLARKAGEVDQRSWQRSGGPLRAGNDPPRSGGEVRALQSSSLHGRPRTCVSSGLIRGSTRPATTPLSSPWSSSGLTRGTRSPRSSPWSSSGLTRGTRSPRSSPWSSSGLTRGSTRPPRLLKRFIEVIPVWIGLFNQFQFPLSQPVFECCFSLDRIRHHVVGFIPN